MKIAIMMIGHYRTGRLNQTLVPNLLKANPGADVFVHTYAWKNTPVQLWHNDHGGQDDQLSREDYADIHARYKPKVCKVERARGGDIHMPSRHKNMGMRWGWLQASRMRRDYEAMERVRYDCVFYARFDLGLREPLAIPFPAKGTLYGSYNLTAIEKNIDGEVFTYGTPEVMDAMSDPLLPLYLDNLKDYDHCGEVVATAIRKMNQFDYVGHRVNCYLLRSDGSELDIRI